MIIHSIEKACYNFLLVLCREPFVRLEAVPDKDLEYFHAVVRKLLLDVGDFTAKSAKDPL